MEMIRFKACPKCGGDLYVNKDIHGDFLNCLQCGYLKDLTEETEIPRQSVPIEKERPAA